VKILITGIDGLIGSAVAKKLVADGHEVVGLSDGSGSNKIPPFKKEFVVKGKSGTQNVGDGFIPSRVLQGFARHFTAGDKPRPYMAEADSRPAPFAKGGESFPYKFHCVDIADSQAVFSIFSREKPDLTIHLAAMAHADVGPEKEALVRRVNVDGSLNVAEAAEKYGGGKMLFFSSAKVLAETTSPEGIDEDSEPKPEGVYARLKREVEVELLERAKKGRLAATIVRPAAVIGRGDSKGNYAKIARAVQRGFFPLLDGGKARRSVVFLDRLAERVRAMIEKGMAPGEVFTLADGAFTLREIVDAMRFCTGYAWCPSAPSAAIERAVKLADALFRMKLSNSDVFHKVLTRFTADFVVDAHRWDERYGPLPELNLVEEMRRVCGTSENKM
jgi:nucleoside-diphosphate-sugar epimerase